LTGGKEVFRIQGMEAVLSFIFALLGAAIGSFLNVCIDRLPEDKSLAYPASHCDACQRHLSSKDMVPVFSYLWLRGRCRYCGASVPRRVFWVELSSGLFFAFTLWHYGLSAEFALNAFYFCLFLVLGLIDLDHKLILNKIIYPASVVALIISISVSAFRGTFTTAIFYNVVLPPGIINAVIGGASGFVLLLIVAIVSRGGMGWGDVKMAMLIGLITGFPMVFSALLMGIILGGLAAAFLLLTKRKKRKEVIPFGPFLALATMVTVLWGSDIRNWYIGLAR